MVAQPLLAQGHPAEALNRALEFICKQRTDHALIICHAGVAAASICR